MPLVALNPLPIHRLDRTHSVERARAVADTPLARQERRLWKRLGGPFPLPAPGSASEAEAEAAVLRHNSAPEAHFEHLPGEGESEEFAASAQAACDLAWKRLQMTKGLRIKPGADRAAAIAAERCKPVAKSSEEEGGCSQIEVSSGVRAEEENASLDTHAQETAEDVSAEGIAAGSVREASAQVDETHGAQFESRVAQEVLFPGGSAPTTSLETSALSTKHLNEQYGKEACRGSSAADNCDERESAFKGPPMPMPEQGHIDDNSADSPSGKEAPSPSSLLRQAACRSPADLEKRRSEASQLAAVSVPFPMGLPTAEQSVSTSSPIVKPSCHDYSAVLTLQSDGHWKVTKSSAGLRSGFLLNHLAATGGSSTPSSRLPVRSCSTDSGSRRYHARCSMTGGSRSSMLQDAQLKRWHLRECKGNLSWSAGSSPLAGAASCTSLGTEGCTEGNADGIRPPLPRSASARHVRQHSWSVGEGEKDEHASALLWEALDALEPPSGTISSPEPAVSDDVEEAKPQQVTQSLSPAPAFSLRSRAVAQLKPWDKLWPSLARRPASPACATAGSRR